MLTTEGFERITSQYPRLRVAVVGDFCLDRYLDIDPSKQETSIETALPVHNVINVRAEPGGAGTIVNNLAALGVGEIHPIGFCGEDGEGYELRRALARRREVLLESLLSTPLRRTFTYCKPLVREEGRPPVELNRLDSKNWTPTPREVEEELIRSILQLAPRLDAMILLEQAELAGTGVVTPRLLEAVSRLSRQHPQLCILADSRRGLSGYPPVCFKMNREELRVLSKTPGSLCTSEIKRAAARLSTTNGKPVFVTLAEQGMIAAAADGAIEAAPALPVRGPIDIVGAGDCVTANLTTALAAGANLAEALAIASIAASIVIHQLGVTGTASVSQIRERIER